jgi:hypothetical protein
MYLSDFGAYAESKMFNADSVQNAASVSDNRRFAEVLIGYGVDSFLFRMKSAVLKNAPSS